jgi:uncharacterized protein YcbX
MFNELRRYETMRARFAKLAVAHCEVEVSPPCERCHFKLCDDERSTQLSASLVDARAGRLGL